MSVGDVVSLVQVRNQITELDLKLSDLEPALSESQAALELARQLANTSNASLLVDTLTLGARVHIHRGESQAALPLLNEALALSRNLAYRRGEAETHTQFGGAYYELDRRAEAENNNNQALQIWQELRDQRGEARVLTAQGDLYMIQDRATDADAALQNAESLWRSLNEPTELANTLLDRAFLATRQGQWQAALALLNEADGFVTEKDAEPYLAGKIATSFGEIYEAYGQLETALGYFGAALRFYRDLAHDKRATVDAGNKVGRVQARLGQYVEAQQQIQQGLAVAMTIANNNLSIGLCHEDLGRVWLEAGSYAPARLEFLAAIDFYSTGTDERALARAQIYLAQTEQLLGNLPQALAAYQKSLPIFQKTSDYTNEAALRFGLGKLALQQGKLDEANENLQRSIKLTEQLRENAWSKELRSSFLASVHDRYQTYVELLMARRAAENDARLEVSAFEASESGRARALLDSLHDLRELRQPSDPALLSEEAKLQKEEQRLIDERSKLVSQGGSEEERVRVEKDLTEVHSKSEALEARIKNNPRFNYLLRPAPLSYEQIRKQLTDSETSLLSYSLGTEKSFAWVVGQHGLYSYELPGKATIEKAANQLIALLQTPPDASEEARLQDAINEVSRLVLEPVAKELQTSRLIVIADGVLQYVPFQILKTSANTNDPLISRFDIVEAPSASALALVKRERVNAQPGAKLLVGFGDAVFSPDYVPGGSDATGNTEATQTRSPQTSKLSMLPRLFNAKRELRTIGELAGRDSAFYTEYNATRDNLLSLDLSQYRILHVVTHGVLNAQRPELSGLVLSLVDAQKKPISGFVSLADIYKLHAPDLVVLSACYTALGQKQDGEGLSGVMRGFMYAGASGVVASLWQVDDRATAELMKYFYENMLQRGMGPAAALRDAQNKIRSQSKWSSPYYWAGFTFQGNYDLHIQASPSANVRGYERLIAGGPVIILLAAAGYWYLRRRRSQVAR